MVLNDYKSHTHTLQAGGPPTVMNPDGFKDDNVVYVSDVSEDDGDEDPGIGPDEVDDDEQGDVDTKMIVIMTDLEAHLVL